MKKLATIATMTLALTTGGVVLPLAANAAGAHQVIAHKKHPVKNKPCGGKVLGLDIAVGKTNICIPL